MLKVGAFLGSFRLGAKESFDKCRELGLDGIELSNIRDELMIESLSESAIEDIRHRAAAAGLVISSVCGDLGGHEFTDSGDVEERIKRTMKIMDVTRALGSRIVQTHIGSIPADPEAPARKVMAYAMDRLGEYGDRIECRLASETRPEAAEELGAFLKEIKHESIKINYDPANLVMKGFDHLAGVAILKDYIVQTHAKDGKRRNGEVPLGEGDVDFPVYIKALRDIGFDGFFIIEREVGPNPAEDIARAKDFLRRF